VYHISAEFAEYFDIISPFFFQTKSNPKKQKNARLLSGIFVCSKKGPPLENG
jgi:hypothetical protein